MSVVADAVRLASVVVCGSSGCPDSAITDAENYCVEKAEEGKFHVYQASFGGPAYAEGIRASQIFLQSARS